MSITEMVALALLYGFAHFGLLTAWEAYRGHRRNQKNRAGGAGAVQGAQGSAGRAEPPAPANPGVGVCRCGHGQTDHFAGTGTCLMLNSLAYAGSSSPPPPPIERRETEIVAWRAWMLVEQDGEWYLRSFNYPRESPMLWEGPAVRADQEPAHDNVNGIYALTKDRFDLFYPTGTMVFVGPSDGSYKSDGHAYGEVALSGLVVEGEKGYRGEQAVVRSLTLKLSSAWASTTVIPLEIMASLETRYQCPVTLEIG